MPVPPRPPLRPPGHRMRRLRRPLPHWLPVLAAAALSAVVVGRLAGDAAAERARWSGGELTVVVLTDVRAGDTVEADVTEVRRLPAALRPDDAVADLPDGAVATVDLAAGEVVVRSRLAPAGTSPTTARLPEGTVGVAVPHEDGLPLQIGDRVELLAVIDPAAQRPAFALARDAAVVDVGERAVTVAIPAEAADRLALTLATGVVVLALSGPRTR